MTIYCSMRQRKSAMNRRLVGMVLGLCLAGTAMAEGPMPIAGTQTDASIFTVGAGLPNSHLSNQALAGICGKGATETPKSSDQVAVILWDERGTPKTRGNDVFASESSTGSANQQTNRLTQN